MTLSICRVQDSFWMRKPGPVGLSIAVVCATSPVIDGKACFGIRLARYLQENYQHINELCIVPAQSQAMDLLIAGWMQRDDLDVILICDEAVAAKGATLHVTFTTEIQGSKSTMRMLRHPDMLYLDLIAVRKAPVVRLRPTARPLSGAVVAARFSLKSPPARAAGRERRGR